MTPCGAGPDGNASSSTSSRLVGVAFILPLLWLLDAAFNQNATQAMSVPTLTLSNFHAAVQLVRGALSRTASISPSSRPLSPPRVDPRRLCAVAPPSSAQRAPADRGSSS